MRISIPKPCNENWNEMTPEQQGAFCKVCSKVVVDFSKMSDEEVIAYLEKKKDEKTCGRFKASQLSPYELKINLQNIAKQSSFRKIFAASLFIFFSSLFICKSDTGDNIVFNKVAAYAVDTTSVTLTVADTTTIVADTILPVIGDEIFTMHTVGEAEMVVVEDTLPVITDTIIPEPPQLWMGIIAVPEPVPMIKGKIACTRPTKTESDSIKKKKQTEKKRNNDREIMGDIIY